MIVLLFITVVSIALFDRSNYVPLLSQHNPEYGNMGIVLGATLVFYAYLGFDIIPAVAEEARNPRKDVPKAIIHEVLYVMAVYLLVSFFVNGVGRLENF